MMDKTKKKITKIAVPNEKKIFQFILFINSKHDDEYQHWVLAVANPEQNT